MQSAKFKVGVTLTGVLVLMDSVNGQKVDSAVFGNYGIMGNSNPGLCSFSFIGNAPSPNPQLNAIPVVAGNATLSIVSDVAWTDQNGDAQTATAMLLSKPYSVANSSDGVSLDVNF